MTASPPATAELTVAHLTPGELGALLQLRRLADYGWGRLTINVRGGTIRIAEYNETHDLTSA